MIDIVGEKISNSVDNAIRRMVNARHFRAGSIVSMPVIYPSGSTVTLEVTAQRGRCFVSDRGGGSQEADFFGATRYFKKEAERVAEQAGINFDGRDMFVAEVSIDALHGAMTVVANASAQAVNSAAMRQAERNNIEIKEELFARLTSIYRDRNVTRDAEVIGASNHKWRISVMVNNHDVRAFFEPVTNHYISVVGTAAKFHDFDRVDAPPKRVSVIKSRQDLGDFYGVIAGASSDIITMSAPDSEFEGLLKAA